MHEIGPSPGSNLAVAASVARISENSPLPRTVSPMLTASRLPKRHSLTEMNPAAMSQRHKHLQLRRKKEEVLEQLPSKQVLHIEVPLGAERQISYQRAEDDGVVQLKEMGTIGQA